MTRASALSAAEAIWPELRDHPERVLVWVAVALSRRGFSPAR